MRPSVAPPDEQVAARLAELIHPATYAQVDAYRPMGLHHRILTLPVMVAFVLSLIWRQLASVSEAVRTLKSEGMLWGEAFHPGRPASGVGAVADPSAGLVLPGVDGSAASGA